MTIEDCENQGIDKKDNNDLTYSFTVNTGKQDLLTEDALKALFEVTDPTTCATISAYDIVKDDDSDPSNTDALYKIADIEARSDATNGYVGLKFDTDEVEQPSGQKTLNVEFKIKAHFGENTLPSQTKKVVVTVVFVDCTDKEAQFTDATLTLDYDVDPASTAPTVTDLSTIASDPHALCQI